jgi:hypothetical protein
MEDVLNDLNAYFGGAGVVDSARPDPEIARLIVHRWGIRAVMMGFAWVAQDLRRLTRRTLWSTLAAEDLMDSTIVSRAMGLMSYMFDLLKAVGKDATAWLASVISSSTDEDVRALAAYTFATDQFIEPRLHDLLLASYHLTEGTSCRLALGLALYMCGEPKYLKEYIDAGLFGPQDYYDELARSASQIHPDLDPSEREKTIVLMLVVPETLGIPSRYSGLMRILALDIGSDGLAYQDRTPLEWKRKVYPSDDLP